jgi:hypothetical protein
VRRGPVTLEAHRVRLDTDTGVCVANEHLGGTRAGTGHDIAIEAVDESMSDELFPPPEPTRWARFLRRPCMPTTTQRRYRHPHDIRDDVRVREERRQHITITGVERRGGGGRRLRPRWQPAGAVAATEP